ncbi:hypothetical protein WJX81_002809 [Elliptochloris bilobata]|uniref:F-box domain-containing protein n=1 Tax=Elliptochloris bilobata TaxID=381761 RepID=A0AAW1QL42_9CHLO
MQPMASCPAACLASETSWAALPDDVVDLICALLPPADKARRTALAVLTRPSAAASVRALHFGPALAPLAGPRLLSPLTHLHDLTISHAQTLQLSRLAVVEMRLRRLDLTGCRLTLDSPAGWRFLGRGSALEVLILHQAQFTHPKAVARLQLGDVRLPALHTLDLRGASLARTRPPPVPGHQVLWLPVAPVAAGCPSLRTLLYTETPVQYWEAESDSCCALGQALSTTLQHLTVQSCARICTEMATELHPATQLAARGGQLTSLHLTHVEWSGASVYIDSWQPLACLGAQLTTLALDIPGMWFQMLAVSGDEPPSLRGMVGGEQLPLCKLLADVCAAAPALERLSLAVMLPGAASNADGAVVAALDAGMMPASDAARAEPGRRAEVCSEAALPAFARLQVLCLHLLTAARPASLVLDMRPAAQLRRVEASLVAVPHQKACRSASGHGSALVRMRIRLPSTACAASADLANVVAHRGTKTVVTWTASRPSGDAGV